MKIVNCFVPSRDSDWTIEWKYLQADDSLPVFSNDSFLIEHSLGTEQRKGVIDSLGQLFIGLTMPGFDDEVIMKNPILHCKIFSGSTVVFDTLISWEALEFKEQYSDLYGSISINVSKKTFYID